MHDCISTIGGYRKSSIKSPLLPPSLYYQVDANKSLFFLWHFNVDNRFIVVSSLDMDWFQLYLLSQ